MLITARKKLGILRWHCDFTLGKRHRIWLKPCSEQTKRQAKAEIEKIRAKMITDGLTSLEEKSLSTRDVLNAQAEYLKEYKPSTWKNYKSFFEKKFKFFHDLDKISSKDIISYQKKRKQEGVCGATINRELEAARAAFGRAINNKTWFSKNPFAHFNKYTETGRTRYLSEQEMASLLIACRLVSSEQYNPHIHDIVVLGIMLGKRKQEILKLNCIKLAVGIPKVDIENQIVITRASGTNKYIADTRTPIPKEVIPLIKELIAKSNSGFLFENPRNGKPYNSVSKAYRSALKLAKIEDFRFHDLRHTCATYSLLASKGDIRAVQEIMGHRDIRTTSKYTHILDERKREVVEATASLISSMTERNEGKVDLENMRNRMKDRKRKRNRKPEPE